jgi:hypothetical protein
MKRMKLHLAVLAFLPAALCLGLGACGERHDNDYDLDDDLDRAGDKIEDAADDVGDEIDDAFDD